MSTYTGKDAIVMIGEKTIGKIKTITLDAEIEVQEDEYLGEDGFDYALGAEKYTSSITYHDNPDDTGQALMTLGAKVDVSLYPRGNVVGNKKVKYSAYVVNDPMTLEKNTKVEKNRTLKVIGKPVTTTITAG